MFRDSPAFSGFSTNDPVATKIFYEAVLGLEVEQQTPPTGIVTVRLASGSIIIYPKHDHSPAGFTVLNFPVDDIDAAVNELKSKGVVFVQYDGLTDDDSIARGLSHNIGPDIAWFKDPGGNILAVLQQA